MDYSEKTKFLAKIAKEVENNPDMFVDILNYAIMGFQKSKKHTKEDGLKYNVKDK
jgi:transposase